jgi:hypothetical protein
MAFKSDNLWAAITYFFRLKTLLPFYCRVGQLFSRSNQNASSIFSCIVNLAVSRPHWRILSGEIGNAGLCTG